MRVVQERREHSRRKRRKRRKARDAKGTSRLAKSAASEGEEQSQGRTKGVEEDEQAKVAAHQAERGGRRAKGSRRRCRDGGVLGVGVRER